MQASGKLPTIAPRRPGLQLRALQEPRITTICWRESQCAKQILVQEAPQTLPANATPVNLWLQFRELQKAHSPCSAVATAMQHILFLCCYHAGVWQTAPGSLKSWVDALQMAPQLPTCCNPSLGASAGCVPEACMTYV